MSYKILFGDDEEAIRNFLYTKRPSSECYVPLNSALINAIKKEKTDIIDIIIEYGCNINLQDKFGNTALHHCLTYYPNNREILQRLIRANSDATIVDKYGKTPLHIAARRTKDVNIIHDLTVISDPNVSDIGGFTPLMEACFHNNNADVISALINISNNINAQNRYGSTAFHYICEYNKHTVVPAILAKNGDFTITDIYNETAYDFARGKCKKIIDKYVLSI